MKGEGKERKRRKRERERKREEEVVSQTVTIDDPEGENHRGAEIKSGQISASPGACVFGCCLDHAQARP